MKGVFMFLAYESASCWIIPTYHTLFSVPSLPLNDRTYTVEILGLHAKANKLKTVFSRACARACVCVCAPPRWTAHCASKVGFTLNSLPRSQHRHMLPIMFRNIIINKLEQWLRLFLYKPTIVELHLPSTWGRCCTVVSINCTKCGKKDFVKTTLL